MQTITIAGDERTARSISSYFQYREVPRESFFGQGKPLPEYETISYSSALRYLQGRRGKGLRIVVGCDYIRAYSGAPGNLTAVWQHIQILKAEGAMVVFR